MIISGSRLIKFRQGWAIEHGSFGVGHYFRRIGATDETLASCGLRGTVRGMFGIGTFPACRKCRRKHPAPTDVRTCVDG